MPNHHRSITTNPTAKSRIIMNTPTSPRGLSAFGLAVLLLFASLSFASGQNKIYARFSDGTSNWTGPVVRAGQTGTWVELQSVSFGTEAAPGSPTGPGGTFAPGKAQAMGVAFSKVVDSLPPRFFLAMVSGSPVTTTTGPDVTIDYVRTVGGTPQTVFRLGLKNVYFTSLVSEGYDGDENLREKGVLDFEIQTITVWPVTGSTLGAPVTFTWNRSTGGVS